uniref:Fibronectin type-III domain-containing protein n=1 Tax=Taenia asiatica TaxID=60517 RepID=A0A0R3W162_TAEAS
MTQHRLSHVTASSKIVMWSFDAPNVKQWGHPLMSPFKMVEPTFLETQEVTMRSKKLIRVFEITSDLPRCKYRMAYINSATQISKTVYEFKAAVERKRFAV